MNTYAVPSGGHEIAPIAQNIMSTYPTSSGASTSKLLAQARLASLLYPGEQSLSKFGWADRVKEYLAEIKLSREDFPPGVRRARGQVERQWAHQPSDHPEGHGRRAPWAQERY